MKINYKTMSKESKREFIKEVLIFSVGLLLLSLGFVCMALSISLASFIQEHYEPIPIIGIASLIVGFFLLVIGGIPLFQKGRFR